MRKRISLKTRHPDLSPESFRDYYESHHVPLGLSFIDRFQWRRYVRNHVLHSSGRPIGFDCYSEFWVDDDADDEALDRFIQSPEFAVLNDDDQRFLDVRCRLSFETRERRIASSRPGPAAASKRAILWKSAGKSPDEAPEIAHAIVAWLGERVVSASLDTAIEALPANAPFDTLLSVWLGEAGPIDLGPSVAPEGGHSILVVDPVETPQEQLLGGRANGARPDRAGGPG
jgi:hypothetical protein